MLKNKDGKAPDMNKMVETATGGMNPITGEKKERSGGAAEGLLHSSRVSWFWQQKSDEIHIRIVCDPPLSSKNDVSVTFKSNSLAATVRGETIIDDKLQGRVEVDECLWVLSADKTELLIMLTQIGGRTDNWKGLLD
mmetsp:Transcript_103649/g.184144  ORF Transcript_103649/g.184144 Transcript_103649/m.184144 type:complete len:137 (+) Transcript_103649:2-412(+)